MPEKIRAMVMGGHTKGFHDFGVMGPIYEKFLSDAGFEVLVTENRDDFKPEAIRSYDVVVCYTTGEELTEEQAKGLLGAVVRGKGFVGVHSAADSFKRTPGYINMLGGRFLAHPNHWPKLTFKVLNPFHPVMAGIKDFQMAEELYLMETCGHFDLLMSTWYEGFERPITWVKPYGHGRVLYTALGHDKQQTENPNFQRIIVNGVRWAAAK
ncbi:MAG: ThuA domain-containing protein [Planctomycetota bacterium]|jgi:type 1 glutamine amidotransferase